MRLVSNKYHITPSNPIDRLAVLFRESARELCSVSEPER